MEVLPEWLETVLKTYRKNKSVQRILQVNCSPAVSQGDNYASELIRIKMRVVLGSGQIANKSLILKRIPKEQLHLQFLEEFQVFHTETKIFTQILPKIEELMIAHEDSSDKLWSNVVLCNGEKEIFMEDLKDAGFKNADRIKGLDLDQALIVVRSLARLHGMSSVLINKKELDTKSLLPYSMAREKELMTHFMKVGLQTLVSVIRQNWNEEWKESADKIENFSNTVAARMRELWNEETNGLLVLNHGDCWTNNFMFKYNLGSPCPTSMKFVDFQESHFNTFGWDLTYLFHTSIGSDLMGEKWDLILEEYRRALEATFEFYGQVPENVPSVAEMKLELVRLLPVGLMVFGSFLPVLLADKEDLMDTEQLLDMESEESAQCRLKLFSNPAYTERAKKYIQACLAHGKL